MRRWRSIPVLIAVVLLAAFARVDAQGRGGAGRAQGPPPTPKADAAIDITGTWVSVISEDWALRMVTPKKGDYTRVPLTPAGRKIADSWDPARDEAVSEQCRAYGAPGLIRLPGRIRISWQDDNTLKLDHEAGTQTRLFHFKAAPASAPSWQGDSAAEWQYTRNPPRTGELKVVTARLRAGYLRKNGVPYSANATLTEYYHRMTAPNGDIWLTVVSELEDPESLREPFVQSTHFKKLAAGATFKPEACSAR
jgi:hypothetical protein